VTFESGSELSDIGAYAFGQSGLRCIVIPASVRVIGEYAFYVACSLTSVTFEEESQLREIGNGSFLGCPCQRGVKIPGMRAKDGTKTEK
jgi:hypothetical protein